MNIPQETIAELKTAKSFEDFSASLETKSLYERLQNPTELSEDELEAVAGGGTRPQNTSFRPRVM